MDLSDLVLVSKLMSMAMGSESDKEQWNFEVRPDNRLLKAVASLLALLVWFQTMAAFINKASISHASTDDPIIIAVVTIWGMVGLVLICAIVWLACGKQVIVALGERFIVTKVVGKWRIFEVKYQVADVKNLRIEERRRSFKGKSELLYSVKFECLGRQRSFFESGSLETAQAFLESFESYYRRVQAN